MWRINGPLSARLRELMAAPLLQFLMIGVLLLSARQIIAPVDASSASLQQIKVSRSAVDAIHDAFVADRGRAPEAEELLDLIDRKVDEEVLFREALRLDLHLHDPIVRRQLQQKMRFLIEDVDLLPEPTEAELQAWLNRHPDRYAQPMTVSFQQVFLSRAKHGREIDAAAVEALRALRNDGEAYLQIGDPLPTGQIIAAADHATLEKHFGREFAQAVFAQSDGVWSLPLRSSLGLHFVRITERTLRQLPAVSDAGPRLLTDYRQEQRDQANRRAFDRLRERYAIDIEGKS